MTRHIHWTAGFRFSRVPNALAPPPVMCIVEQNNMWPFSKTKGPPKDWLTESQAKEVARIFYRDHDANCWYACAMLARGDGVRIAAPSRAEAIELANALADEVFLKSGRRLQGREEP